MPPIRIATTSKRQVPQPRRTQSVPATPATATLAQRYATLHHELQGVVAADKAVRQKVGELETGLANWVQERPSRAWLARSTTTRERFVPVIQRL